MIIKNGQVVTDSEESDHDELVEEEIQENEEELEDGSHLVLVTRRVLKTQVTENDVDDQRDNLFHMRCFVKGTPCSIVIDSGSLHQCRKYNADQKVAKSNPTPS